MTLYASQAGPRSSSDLYTINPATGVATSVATMSVALTGMAMDPTTGIMYGSTSNSSANSRSLVTVDLVTGATTILGQLISTGPTTTHNCADIAFDSSGQLYGWSEAVDRLVKIDKTNGACVVLRATGLSTEGDGMDFDWQDNLFGIFNEDDGSLFQVKPTFTTPLIPGAELAAGAGPDDLDETYGQTTRTITTSRLTAIAGLHGDGYPVSAGAMQGDMFYIIVNQFGSPVYLATVDYYGVITTIAQTLDGIDALATDDPAGRSNWYGVSPYPFVESWENGTINTNKWEVYRQYGSSPLNPNLKRTRTRITPGLDDLDETLDHTLESESWFEITDAEAVLGSHSIVLNHKHPTVTNYDKQQLVHWDELGGGANDVEYWIAYLFMIPDWLILNNSDSSQVELPDFRTNSGHSWYAFTAIGNYLLNDTATTGSFYDWNGDDHPVTDGAWHELRIGYMRRSSDSKVVVTQYRDGELIVDHAVSGGGGLRVYGIQWNSQYYYNETYYGWGEPPESLVYVDPIIWSAGSDPGPITGFNFVRPDFIGPSTVLYPPQPVVTAPFISPTGSAFPPTLTFKDIQAPFIGPTSVAFPPNAPQDVPMAFIGPTSSLTTPAILESHRGRITQDAVQAMLQRASAGRISQDAVQAMLQRASAGRVTQDAVQAMLQQASASRVTQEHAQVMISNVHEDVNVFLID